jgi:hypothetical protein
LTSTVIVRRVTQNRMVTKGYRKGVYDRITEGTLFGKPGKTTVRDASDGAADAARLARVEYQNQATGSAQDEDAAQARAKGVSTKIRRHRIAGLGSRRMTCHTMKLIDEILRAGETANESVLSRSGLEILKTAGIANS